jgi:RNA polymerase sigma-70 factor (ECF subfamily)
MSAAGHSLSDARVRTQVIHDLYADEIRRYCRRRLRSREDAEDAAQIVFLTAQRCLANGVEPRSERAWLFKIAEHVVLGQWRTLRQRAHLASPVSIDTLADSAVAAGSGRLPELVDLPAALARVPAAQRRALVLREWHGLSYAEVAEELGVTAATVETLIFRARGSLAKELGGPARRSRASRVLGVLPSVHWVFGGGAALKVAAGVAPIAVVAWGVLAPQQPAASAEAVPRAPVATLHGAVTVRGRQQMPEVHPVLARRQVRGSAARVSGATISSVVHSASPEEAVPAPLHAPPVSVPPPHPPSDGVPVRDVPAAPTAAPAVGDANPASVPAEPVREESRAEPPTVRIASPPAAAGPAEAAQTLSTAADRAPGKGAPSGAGVPATPPFAGTPAPDGAGPSQTHRVPCSRECSNPSERAAHPSNADRASNAAPAD